MLRGARFYLALFLLALTLRVGFATARPPHDDGDQRTYRGLATSIANGDGYALNGVPNLHLHPLLPTVHALAILVVLDARVAGMALTLLIGALLPVVAAWSTALLFGRAEGLWAGLLLALAPFHILASARLEPDLLAALICFWIVALLARGDTGLAGIVIGLGYLTRPELIFLTPMAAVAARASGASIPAIGRLLVGVLALSSFFVLFLHAATQRWTLSGKDQWVYLLGVHQANTWDQPLHPESIPLLQRQIGSPFEHLRKQPVEFIGGYLIRSILLGKNLAKQLLIILVPLAVFGFIRGWRTSRTAILVLTTPLAILPIYPLGATFFRHSLIPGSFLVALAGIGVAFCIRMLSPSVLEGKTP